MKKTIFLAVMISIFSITATFAQDTIKAETKDKTSHIDKGQWEHKDPLADLNLSQEQKDKIKALNDEQKTQFEAIKNDASINDEQKKAKMMELRKSRKEKMEAILTTEQKAKWEEKMKNGGYRRGNK